MFYLRKHVGHYAEYSNLAHEGTNNAIKYSSTPVKPSFLLSHSFQLINTQTEMSNAHKRYEASKQFHTIDTRLDDMCKTHLNQLATEMLHSEMLASHLFQSLRTTTQTWLVVLLPEHSPRNVLFPK